MHMLASLTIIPAQSAGTAQGSIPWLWIGIGAVVLIAAVVMVLLLRAGKELETEIRLVVTKGQRRGQALKITATYATVGSESDNDVVVPDDKVSKHHARFHYRKGTLTVSDSNSLYGTFLNGQRIEEATCTSGDTLRLGTEFECRVEIGSS